MYPTPSTQAGNALRELVTWLLPPIAPAIAVGVIWTIVVGGTFGFTPTTGWTPIAFTLLAYVVAAHLRLRYLSRLRGTNKEDA